MTRPSLCVLLPAYNAQAWIQEAVQAILEQSFTDYELLVIDDGSTDSTPSLLEAFTDPRLRLVRNPRNLGVAASLNRGLREARAALIARCDADDICLPERFRIQWEFLESHPDHALVGSAALLIDTNGHTLGERHLPESDSKIRALMCLRNPILHPTTMYRKEAVASAGFYHSRFEGLEDYELWVRLARLGKLHNLPRPLIKHRIHPSSASTRHRVRTELLALWVRARHVRQLLPAKRLE